jgi:hypothetical protein
MIDGSKRGGFGMELLHKFKVAFLRRLAQAALPADVLRNL